MTTLRPTRCFLKSNQAGLWWSINVVPDIRVHNVGRFLPINRTGVDVLKEEYSGPMFRINPTELYHK